MTLLPMLLATLAAGTAHAKGDDPVGLRFKLSTGIVQNTTAYVANDDVDDPMKSKTTDISLFSGPARMELTYQLAEGIEAGALIGYDRTTSKFENDETEAEDENTSLDTELMFAITGAYNIKLGGGARLFIQPIVGIDNMNSTTKDKDVENKVNNIVYGGDVGVRLKAFKRASFDISGEYLGLSGTFINDGEKDEDNKDKVTQIGLRSGISIMF